MRICEWGPYNEGLFSVRCPLPPPLEALMCANQPHPPPHYATVLPRTSSSLSIPSSLRGDKFKRILKWRNVFVACCVDFMHLSYDMMN